MLRVNSTVFALVLWIVAAGFPSLAAAEGLPLEDFPGARVAADETLRRNDYVLALGNYRRVGGRWEVARERRLTGQLRRKTLELPDNQTAADGFQFYRQQLEKFAPRNLYSCEGRACGTSNSWANNHFGVLQLYGLDQHQYYGAYEVTGADDRPYYVTLYAVLRGNRRVFVQVEVMQPDQVQRPVLSSPDALVTTLKRQGYIVFPGLSVTGDEELSLQEGAVAVLAQVLEQNPQWRVALVGHDYGATDLEQQRRNATRYAEYVRDALLAAEVSEDRLEVYGLGSLAPAGRGERTARVEAVLLPVD